MLKKPDGVGSEIGIASAVVLILFVMVVPLPTFMLDILLSANIALSLAVLLTAFYALRPLDFAVFPGLLLLTTLFRLSLNVASTRLILSQADAGNLISSFGQFVVSGNYVVGTIIFLVLVIINFVVITKGSGRIAEVTARFTLDAMPGKQMAIDADLNAGLVDEAEARQRRKDVSREADFYGAMDGASKFVRGDAIAGLLITGINIIGGMIIGVMQLNLSFGDAAATFMLLSIGDGLVSQVPALLISTAAGIIVSRASSESNLARDIQHQILGKPYPVLITGGVLVILGLVPGLPMFPFWLLAGGTIVLGRNKLTAQKAEEKQQMLQAANEAEEPVKEEPQDLIFVDTLEFEIGYGLISIVDPDQQGDLLDRVSTLRKQLALELGILIPPVRIRDNVSLGSNSYIIKLRGNPIGEGEVLVGYHLALLPEDLETPPPGIRVKDPTFGLPAVWIAERSLPEAEKLGLTVVEAPAVVTTHLLEALRRNAYKLLDRQEVKKLIDKVKENSPALVEELVPNLMTIGGIQKILKRLLRETIPIRDLVSILESIADHAPSTKNVEVLTEHVRSTLCATITMRYTAEDGRVHGFVLDPLLEHHLIEKAQNGELNPNTLGLEPQRAEQFLVAADRCCKRLIADGKAPVLITSPVLRPSIFHFMAPTVRDVAVLSYNDLDPEASVEIVDQLKLP